jgi:hypothetical protein
MINITEIPDPNMTTTNVTTPPRPSRPTKPVPIAKISSIAKIKDIYSESSASQDERDLMGGSSGVSKEAQTLSPAMSRIIEHHSSPRLTYNDGLDSPRTSQGGDEINFKKENGHEHHSALLVKHLPKALIDSDSTSENTTTTPLSSPFKIPPISGLGSNAKIELQISPRGDRKSNRRGGDKSPRLFDGTLSPITSPTQSPPLSPRGDRSIDISSPRKSQGINRAHN